MQFKEGQINFLRVFTVCAHNISVKVRYGVHTFWLMFASNCAAVSCSGIILWMGSANEGRHYIVTLSLIGLAHSKKDPCYWTLFN